MGHRAAEAFPSGTDPNSVCLSQLRDQREQLGDCGLHVFPFPTPPREGRMPFWTGRRLGPVQLGISTWPRRCEAGGHVAGHVEKGMRQENHSYREISDEQGQKRDEGGPGSAEVGERRGGLSQGEVDRSQVATGPVAGLSAATVR